MEKTLEIIFRSGWTFSGTVLIIGIIGIIVDQWLGWVFRKGK